MSNGTVRDCDDGVVVGGGGRHAIARITSRDNGSDGFLILSNFNFLSFNTALGSDDDGFGIDGDNNVLKFNKASSNSDQGFEIIGNNNVLSFNVTDRNEGHGFGIGGDNNSVTNNVATRNGVVLRRVADEPVVLPSAGFEVFGRDNELKLDHADRNFWGFFIAGSSSRNSLGLNVAFANEEDGFFVAGDANQLSNNVAKRNGSDGIDVDEGATDNVLGGNIAFLNNQNNEGTFDLADRNADCDANTWVNNIFGTRSQACINLRSQFWLLASR